MITFILILFNKIHQYNQFLTESFINLDVFHHLHSYEDIIYHYFTVQVQTERFVVRKS
jgi:hypothetical protein